MKMKRCQDRTCEKKGCVPGGAERWTVANQGDGEYSWREPKLTGNGLPVL